MEAGAEMTGLQAGSRRDIAKNAGLTRYQNKARKDSFLESLMERDSANTFISHSSLLAHAGINLTFKLPAHATS